MVLLQEIILKPGCLYTRLIVVKKNVDIKFCVYVTFLESSTSGMFKIKR